jgi:hypothetical protein
MRGRLSTPGLLWEIDICTTVDGVWAVKQKQCQPSSTIKDRKKKIQIPDPPCVLCTAPSSVSKSYNVLAA